MEKKGDNLEGTEKLNVFQVRLSTKQKIVNLSSVIAICV